MLNTSVTSPAIHKSHHNWNGQKYIAHIISKISLDCIHFEIKTYSASGGCTPRPLHLGSTTSGNPLSEILDPPLILRGMWTG